MVVLVYGLLVNYSLVSVKLSLFTWFPVAAWVLNIFPVFSRWRQSERLSYFYKDSTISFKNSMAENGFHPSGKMIFLHPDLFAKKSQPFYDRAQTLSN
jgi:hypothetical protein